MRLLPVLLLPFLLSACTSYIWVKPVGDQATFGPDSYACKQQALASAPPVFHQQDVFPQRIASPDVVKTNCVQRGAVESCQTRYYMHDSMIAPPPVVDLNEDTRNDLYSSCMQAKGWVLQAVEDK